MALRFASTEVPGGRTQSVGSNFSELDGNESVECLILLSRLRKIQVEDGAKLIGIERFCQQVSCPQGFCSEKRGEARAGLSRRDGEYHGIRDLA